VIQSSSIGWNLEYPAWLPRRKVPTPALRFRVEQPQSYLSPEKRAFERAQLGLLGMVLGEQAGGWFLTKRIEATNVASVHVVGELNHRQAVLLDAFSRSCIGWALQRSLEAGLVLEALRMTLRQRRPRPGLVHHSDRGVQYAAQDYRAQLQQHGIRISMSRRGNVYDNAMAESFMKTLKYEEVYRTECRNLEEAQVSIKEFLEKIYNQKRLHSALGYRPPREFEQSLSVA